MSLSLAIGAATLVVAVVASYQTMFRSDYYAPRQTERSIAGAELEEIHVALVWPKNFDPSAAEMSSSLDGIPCTPPQESVLETRDGQTLIPSLPQGAQIALDELSDGSIKLFGKKKIAIKTIPFEELVDSSGVGGAAVADQVIRDGRIVAVIGHQDSASAIPASIAYEQHGLLFMAPTSTIPRLTHHGFQYTFRLTPTDPEIAEKMIAFAKFNNWNRLGIYFARTPGGESLAAFLEEQAAGQGLKVAFMQSYLRISDSWDPHRDFRPIIAIHGQDEYDAIMIADELPRAAKLILDLREMGRAGRMEGGKGTPIIGSDKLDNALLWRYAGGGALPIYVASAQDPDATTAVYTNFKDRYSRKYCTTPNYPATQGYLALRVLIDAVDKSRSADPVVLANTLRDEESFNGLFATFSFTDLGDVKGRHVFIKSMQNNGTFRTQRF